MPFNPCAVPHGLATTGGARNEKGTVRTEVLVTVKSGIAANPSSRVRVSAIPASVRPARTWTAVAIAVVSATSSENSQSSPIFRSSYSPKYRSPCTSGAFSETRTPSPSCSTSIQDSARSSSAQSAVNGITFIPFTVIPLPFRSSRSGLSSYCAKAPASAC